MVGNCCLCIVIYTDSVWYYIDPHYTELFIVGVVCLTVINLKF